jgi:hypothetical protein
MPYCLGCNTSAKDIPYLNNRWKYKREKTLLPRRGNHSVTNFQNTEPIKEKLARAIEKDKTQHYTGKIVH